MSGNQDKAALTRILATALDEPVVLTGNDSGQVQLPPGLYEFAGYDGSSFIKFASKGATIAQDGDGHYVDCVRFIHGQTRVIRVDPDNNNLIWTVLDSDDGAGGAELRYVRLTFLL